MILYFDTSALIKLVVEEDGSQLAVAVLNSGHRAASSVLAYPEGRAALAAARRGGRLTARPHRQALEDFEAIHQELFLVGLDLELAHRAGGLAEEHGLRGADAVHLASALLLGPDTVVVTWDRELAHAAERTGCGVAPAS